MKRLFIGLMLVCLVLPAFAQRKAQTPLVKKPLTHAAYDEWKSITFQQLTMDGKNLAYTLNPEDGDGKLVFQNLERNQVTEVSRAGSIQLTEDGRHAVFLIKAQKDSLTQLRRLKKKKEDMPKDSLGIFDFQSRQILKIPQVKSFKIPKKAGGWMAYLSEALGEIEDNGENDTKTKKISDENGYPLVLMNLQDKSELKFDYVKDYVFTGNGNALVIYSTGNGNGFEPGIYWHDMSNGQTKHLYRAHIKHKFKFLSLDDPGEQLAFVADLDTTKALIREPKLMYWKKGMEAAEQIADEKTAGIPENWLVSDNFSPYFSKDGARLFLGTNPPPILQDTTLLSEEMVQVEVWHWQDDYIYPEQNVRADSERKRSYLAVIDLAKRQLVQVGSPEISEIRIDEEGKADMALGMDDRTYRMMRTWDISAYNDLYAIDLNTGSSQLIAAEVKGMARLSPDGGYAYWYSSPDTAWYVHELASGRTANLTEGIDVSFGNELTDVPDFPSPYGLAGWSKGEEFMLVYDRYDIWQLDPKGEKAAVRITQNGRENQRVYRYEKLDPEERTIDLSAELLLSVFEEGSKDAGFARWKMAKGSPEMLLKTANRYNLLQKAQAADVLLYSRESFQEFPDLHVADMRFGKTKKVTQANPQQGSYLWGTAEIVKWNSLDNIPLEGILYKPENFDPNKKYPMVVVYYERFSNTVHQHHKPEPIRSLVHRTMYVSNDYLIFVPDIVYQTGYPGESAFNCIIPGVSSLIAKGFVDKDRVGIQGHSWSGYQTAYILTRTNMFRAAEAGAIVANMTSAYGGIRWQSGLARMFQYEKAQSRLGVSLWENPLPYIENSPLFFANKIETPMLLLHNDADGAVPWYQGIEMYLAMRRLNKPTWMLNYNGEPHWPVKRENRIDFQTRMMQFFDHYLKGAPMPQWMEKGVPAVEKGILQGLELVEGD
ncbi:prolyl oligopeptidase family serine peptidase [Cecembia sp.]|uniref:S9 family peptidase n=1 Tax=Cecembia sp. TaxID=1898110 RepID=UPI0025C08F7A|nr:prolyl oligopeptidase family serine peptidase [Cecembia sp.]